jgi:hypothetical protein
MDRNMNLERLSICPHLKGSEQGVECRVVKKLIKDMQDVNIKICMSRRHEACSVYFCSLQMFEYGGAYKSVQCIGI